MPHKNYRIHRIKKGNTPRPIETIKWNFETIRGSLVKPKWPKLVWPRKNAHSSFSSLVHSLLPKDNPFKNIFDFTTTGDLDCVAAEERLPTLHYSVDSIFLSFGIMGFILEL